MTADLPELGSTSDDIHSLSKFNIAAGFHGYYTVLFLSRFHLFTANSHSG